MATWERRTGPRPSGWRQPCIGGGWAGWAGHGPAVQAWVSSPCSPGPRAQPSLRAGLQASASTRTSGALLCPPGRGRGWTSMVSKPAPGLPATSPSWSAMLGPVSTQGREGPRQEFTKWQKTQLSSATNPTGDWAALRHAGSERPVLGGEDSRGLPQFPCQATSATSKISRQGERLVSPAPRGQPTPKPGTEAGRAGRRPGQRICARVTVPGSLLGPARDPDPSCSGVSLTTSHPWA